MTYNICKHNKFGFCKFGEKCQFRHINTECSIKNCNIQECENRHPRFCYYQKYYGRCKFTTFCKYSHEEETILCENIDRIIHLEQKQAEKDLHIINLEKRKRTETKNWGINCKIDKFWRWNQSFEIKFQPLCRHIKATGKNKSPFGDTPEHAWRSTPLLLWSMWIHNEVWGRLEWAH